MTEYPAGDPQTALLRAGELLLNGWGYNWYRAENLMRADDLLLRSQADAMLGDALAAFRRAEAVFRQKYVGPPRRDAPLPDPARIAELQAFRTMLDTLDDIRTRLRGAFLPPEDKIARRHRSEADLLVQLGHCDARLAAAAQALRAEAMAITPADLGGMPGRMASRLSNLQDLLHQRAELLNLL